MKNVILFPPNPIGRKGTINESNLKFNRDEFIQGHPIGSYLNYIKHCSI